MSKARTVVIFVGTIILCLASIVTTYFGLLSFGVVQGEPQAITVTLDDVSREYDGTPLNSTTYEYSKSELDPEHTLEVYFLNELTEVGTCEIKANVIIYNKDGQNTTDK